MALLDMEFNMGSNFTEQKWPSLYRAVEQRDWLKASQESHRYQVSRERNNDIQGKFEQAHNQDFD
jgi:GH24 family phage-related lysozyme (muramidase)